MIASQLRKQLLSHLKTSLTPSREINTTSDGLLREWATPLMLLFLCILSYGLLIPWLGFYWDDWDVVWFSHSFGSSGLRELWSFRPFLGWLYTLTTPLLGEAPINWHLLALLTRSLGTVAIWWGLRGLWPHRTREVACIALLFAVYPGSTLQPIAETTSHVLIVLVLFVFSLGAMIWALQVSRLALPLTILALLCSASHMMFLDYFVGLELLRPVFLWLFITERTTNNLQRFRRTLTNLLPYLAVLGAYLIWRIFLFKSAWRDFDGSVFLASFAANPLSELLKRLGYCLTDLIESGLMAWTQTFRPDIFDLGSSSVRIAWGIVFISATMVALYLMRLKSDTVSRGSGVLDVRIRWAKQAVIIGVLAILVGGVPVWFGGRQVFLEGLTNRYTLTMMLGASILLVGIIHIMIRTQLQQIVVLSIIVGLAVGFHFRNANQFRRDWLAHKSLFWQLSWRVPYLKPGTSVMIDKSPLLFSDDYDYVLARPLNFIYAPEHSSAQLNYWFFNLSRQSGRGELPRLVDDMPIKRELRTESFAGSTSNNLAVWFSPPSCLRVLDPSRDELPQLPPLARAAQSISHLDRIVVDANPPARPPAAIFGPEPERCWCYYFQKADLARQMGDWQQVAQMGDEARRLSLKPSDMTEWFPFIEGYARVGQYDKAKEISKLAFQAMPTAEPALNNLWKRLESVGPQDAARQAFIADMKAQLSPSTP